jgi:DNA-binding IclR family transcriptional regulator
MPAEPEAPWLRLDARALDLGYRLGSVALLIVLDLASHSTDSGDGAVVAASYRDIARRLGVSKDTIGRRMALLSRAGVVERLGSASGRFDTCWYRLRLDRAGVDRNHLASQ